VILIISTLLPFEYFYRAKFSMIELAAIVLSTILLNP